MNTKGRVEGRGGFGWEVWTGCVWWPHITCVYNIMIMIKFHNLIIFSNFNILNWGKHRCFNSWQYNTWYWPPRNGDKLSVLIWNCSIYEHVVSTIFCPPFEDILNSVHTFTQKRSPVYLHYMPVFWELKLFVNLSEFEYLLLIPHCLSVIELK